MVSVLFELPLKTPENKYFLLFQGVWNGNIEIGLTNDENNIVWISKWTPVCCGGIVYPLNECVIFNASLWQYYYILTSPWNESKVFLQTIQMSQNGVWTDHSRPLSWSIRLSYLDWHVKMLHTTSYGHVKNSGIVSKVIDVLENSHLNPFTEQKYSLQPLHSSMFK